MDKNAMNFDKPTTPMEYKQNKRQICQLLRVSSDPRPVCNILCGTLEPHEAATHIAEKLKQDPTARLVRGYRLITFANRGFGFSFCGRSHFLLKTGDGKLQCFTRAPERCIDTPYIFIPSSRMHKDLSDKELLSGKFQLSTIVGGCSMMTSALFLTKTMWSSIERMHFCTAPEEGKAMRCVVLWNFPLFPEFLQSEEKGIRLLSSRNDAAIAFGMPYRFIEDCETADEVSNTRVAMNTRLPWANDLPEKWIKERDVWLPSTNELLRTLELIYVEKAVPDALCTAVLFHLYNKLSDEYIGRINLSRDKFCAEFHAKASRFN
jgi:hypothetical protein